MKNHIERANDSHHDRSIERVQETMSIRYCIGQYRDDGHEQLSFLDTKRIETSGHRLRHVCQILSCSSEQHPGIESQVSRAVKVVVVSTEGSFPCHCPWAFHLPVTFRRLVAGQMPLRTTAGRVQRRYPSLGLNRVDPLLQMPNSVQTISDLCFRRSSLHIPPAWFCIERVRVALSKIEYAVEHTALIPEHGS